MTYASHSSLGFVVGFSVASGLHCDLLTCTLFAIVVCISSILPDRIEFFGKHRTWSHWAGWIPLCAVAGYYLTTHYHFVLAGVPFAYALHLLLDALSKSGIPLGYRSRLRFGLYITRTYTEYYWAAWIFLLSFFNIFLIWL